MNLHTLRYGQRVIQSGIDVCKTYAWQIKIPDKIGFNEIETLLEKSIARVSGPVIRESSGRSLFLKRLTSIGRMVS
jgi:hypothetical protein